MKTYKSYSFYLLTILLVIAGLISCSKYYDPPEVFETGVEKPFSKKRKILLIVLDGAAGPEIKKIAPPTLMGLIEHSKYSWESIADARTADGPSWINLLTGKSAAAAGIVDSTLAPVTDDEDEHDDIPVYSNFFQRLLISGYLPKMVAITPWAGLAERGLKFTESTITVSSDQYVKDSAVTRLADSKLGVLMANFNGVNLAGKASAFSADQVTYKDAVLKVDGYIKEILDAVKKRPEYALEDWLTIVTSTHGGVGNTYGGASFPERKVFAIYNNPNFTKKELITPPISNTMTFTGDANTGTRRATIPFANATSYEIGASGDFTFITKVMMLSKPSGGSNHVTLAYKANHAYSGVRGWTIQHAQGGYYRSVIGDGTNIFIEDAEPAKSSPVGTWDVIALRIYDSVSKRWAGMLVNGNRTKLIDITGRNITAGNFDFGLGTISTSQARANFILHDFAIWKTKLTDQYIKNYYCLNGIPSNDANIANLIGYWPCDEGVGPVLKNFSSQAVGKDAVFATEPTWTVRAATSCEAITNTTMLTNTEIVPNIFYWVGFTPLTAWGFEAKEWLSKYETEFVK